MVEMSGPSSGSAFPLYCSQGQTVRLACITSLWVEGKQTPTLRQLKILAEISSYAVLPLGNNVVCHDHVDGVRIRLWTATTNKPIVQPPADIRAWRTMTEWHQQGSLPIRPPELSGNPTSSHLVVKQEVHAKEIMNFAVRSNINTLNGYLICHKILSHGASGFTFPPKEGVLRIFVALKNPLPSVGFQPANIGSRGKHANHHTTEDDWNNVKSLDRTCFLTCYPSKPLLLYVGRQTHRFASSTVTFLLFKDHEWLGWIIQTWLVCFISRALSSQTNSDQKDHARHIAWQGLEGLEKTL
jgi:hypothetical protein